MRLSFQSPRGGIGEALRDITVGGAVLDFDPYCGPGEVSFRDAARYALPHPLEGGVLIFGITFDRHFT